MESRRLYYSYPLNQINVSVFNPLTAGGLNLNQTEPADLKAWTQRANEVFEDSGNPTLIWNTDYLSLSRDCISKLALIGDQHSAPWNQTVEEFRSNLSTIAVLEVSVSMAARPKSIITIVLIGVFCIAHSQSNTLFTLFHNSHMFTPNIPSRHGHAVILRARQPLISMRIYV